MLTIANKWIARAALAASLSLALPSLASADTYGSFPKPPPVAVQPGEILSSDNTTLSKSVKPFTSTTVTIDYRPGRGSDGGPAPWLLSMQYDPNDPSNVQAVNFTVTDSNGIVIGQSQPAKLFATPDVPPTFMGDPSHVVNGVFVTKNPGPVTVTISNFLPAVVVANLTLYPR